MKQCFRALSLLLVALLAIQPAFAQGQKPTEASLRVTVVDPNGEAIPKARVVAGKQAKEAVTGARGEATLAQLTIGKTQITVTADGFAPRTIKDFNLKSGANQIEVKMQIATVEESVVVAQDKREAKTDPRGDAFTTVLTAEQIAALPDDPDEFEQAIRNMAGPGATFRVNGFRGGKLPPKNQIREIRFRTNAYAAESHESSFMSVDILTKPGIENWHGSFNFGFRDESLNARNAFAPNRAAEQNRRFGFELGGPLWKNHTSLFLSADGVNSYEARTIVAALPTGNFYDQNRQPWRTLNMTARLEHLLTKTHTARVEYQRNATRRDNLGVGNYDFPERGFTSDTAEHIARFADSGAVGKKLFNEFRFQARWQTVDLNALSNAQTIQVLNAFTRGGGQVNSSRREREFEIADNLDITFKKHTIRTGVQLEASNYLSNELRNLNGTFIFSSLDAFRANRPTTYTQRRGIGQVDFNQVQFGWYGQDDWRVAKSLTFSYGLRHEVQTNLSDKNNFMPRIGFAWSPSKKGNSVIRGGAGIFYDWFASETYEQALRVNGQQQSDLIIRNPGFPNPFSGGQALTLPASRIQIDPNLRMPKIQRASVGVEQTLPGNLRLMSHYFFTKGINRLRGRNINAPINGVRPIADAGNITQIESSASSTSHTWMVNMNWFKMGKFMLGANYSLSKITDETDSALSLPANNFDLRAERGPSLQDIRHRFFGMGNYRLTKSLGITSIFQASSATPYNITTGFDDNGDTIINDRPRGVGRNTARGAGMWDLSTRLSYSFAFGKPPEAQGAGGPQVRVIRGGSDSGDMLGMMSGMPGQEAKRFRMEFFIQSTNLFNNVNPVGFSGVQASPFFGQPIAAMPGRRLETGMRFSF
ncbi:MAG: TonB-dependent receptor [Acidobacteriota bacterium]|nr:TonB-dependent receptor [Acidobacteriota bacterium]